MTNFYQEALSESLKTLINGYGQVCKYLELLGGLKKDFLAEKLVGKEFPLSSLYATDEYSRTDYEDVPYKAILVESSYDHWNFMDYCLQDRRLFTLNVSFMRNPTDILNSKRKLTDKEKQILKNLKEYYDVIDGRNPGWFSSDKLRSLCNELSHLKHSIYVLIDKSWGYSASTILQEDFITRGIRAAQPLIK